MDDNDNRIGRAIAGLIAAGIIGGSGGKARAADPPPAPRPGGPAAPGTPGTFMGLAVTPMMEEMEECYGIVKAGKNDCNTDTSACGGTSTKDSQPDAYIFLPAGTCLKIVGGTLKRVKPGAPRR